jgi:ATP-dependent Lon protease
MFSSGYGFVVDYLAEILRHLRNQDFSDQYKHLLTLSSDISTRDRDGINKTFSGLMKILFPQGGASKEEIEEILRFAIEGRKRVKDQLMRIDTTYADVDFSYSDESGKKISVKTLEEIEYPRYFHHEVETGDDLLPESSSESSNDKQAVASATKVEPASLTEKHIVINENQRGISYDELFGPYLQGAKHITITDPYIRMFYQARNLMELLETIVRNKAEEDEVVVSLVTVEDEFKADQQREWFDQIQNTMLTVGIKFAYSFDNSGAQHARHIITDQDWKISLDRGLDIFQQYDMNDAFQLTNRMQKQRPCKAFEVSFIKL